MISLQDAILITTIYSMIRMTVYMVSSNIYTVKHQIRTRDARRKQAYYRPHISIIVPAHNEAEVIERTLESLRRSNYPKSRFEVIVANDGSTDDTADRVKKFARKHRKDVRVYLVSRPNRGKAEALNHAIRKRAKGSLVMCLDADSLVHPDCIKNAVQYFRDKLVVAVASNVNIIENGTLLGLAQRFEYLFSHQLKKANTTLNMEYIIGGVGSTFRKATLESVGYYDSNTMTEDIDLTMKIVAKGNKQNRVVFASDALTYTEPVLTYKGLILQRFRWKYGRLQAFIKNRKLFFNTSGIYSRLLTWFLLPVTVLYELLMMIEPFVVVYILYLCFSSGDPSTLMLAAILFCVLITLNVWASDHVSFKDKVRLTLYAPATYVLLYALAGVEYVAVFKSAFRIHKLPSSLRNTKTTWKSPARNAAAIVK